METVYIESTVVSYLAAKPSRDLIVNAHQQITCNWWDIAKTRFNLFISEAVLEEIGRGDKEAAIRRQNIVKEIPILELKKDIRKLVQAYDDKLGLPPKANVDLVHISFAVSYEIDYLVTWNCAHIANGEIIRRLLMLNQEMKRKTPVILTPEELIEPIIGDKDYDK